MLKSIFKTSTFQHSIVTITGTIITGLLGTLFFIILARTLGPAEFGLLTVAITTAVLIADITDLGTNTGIVKFVSQALNKARSEAMIYLKWGLTIKLLVWFAVLLTGLILAPLASLYIFNKPELTLLFRSSIFGAGGISLLFVSVSALQAFQRFFIYSLVGVLANLIRVVGIVLLIYLGVINLPTFALIYFLVPFIGFFIASSFLPVWEILNAKLKSENFKKMFAFNKWVALFTIIAAISSRLDIFLNAKLLSSFELGIYAAANQLTSVVPQIVSSVGAVVAPKFAEFDTQDKMITYLKKFQLFVLGIAGVGVLIIPISFYLIPLLYTGVYQGSVSVFIVLFLAMLVFLVALPIHTAIIYYFTRPDIFSWVALGHLLIMGVLGYILIVKFGVMGTAATVLIGNIFIFFAPLVWFLLKIKK